MVVLALKNGDNGWRGLLIRSSYGQTIKTLLTFTSPAALTHGRHAGLCSWAVSALPSWVPEHQTGCTLPSVLSGGGAPSEATIMDPKCISEQEVQEALQGQVVPEGCPTGRLYVPLSARSSVLAWGHQSKIACHPGVHRTLSLIQQGFWWPSMTSDVRTYVVACSTCSCNKPSHRPLAGLLQPLPIPSHPGPTSQLTSLPNFLLPKVTTQF